MYRPMIAVSSALFLTTSAYAWQADIQGPDVFGTTKALVTEGLQRDGMVIQCDSKGSMAFAYIFRKKEFEDVTEAPAILFVQTSQDNPPAKMDATLRAWNDNYGGVVVNGMSPELMGVIKAIGSAKGKIGVGFESSGNQWSAEFSSRGSTNSISKLMKACDLEKAALPAE